MSFDILPDYDQIEDIKFAQNVGALFDVVTGSIHIGKYGEAILNGGHSSLVGVVGKGNNFKTTIADHITLVPASHQEFTRIDTYDTEMNISKQRKTRFAARHGAFKLRDIVSEGVWKITDKTLYYANKWYEKFKDIYNQKIKLSAKFTRESPFRKMNGKGMINIIIPTFSQIDSFTEFETEDIANIQEENELGDSGGNTIHMRSGLHKVRFLTDVLRYLVSGSGYMTLTAHIGKEIPMDPRAAPDKKLTFLKNGDKIKGTTDKFFYLTTWSIQCQNATPLINDTTKGPEYPRDKDDALKGDTDLFQVTCIVLRNKLGLTGIVLYLVVSQREGVLGPLTEFNYIKTNNRFGISGNLQHYHLDLLPDISLSRTTVRSKLKENEKLCRATRITSELCQMIHLWDREDNFFCSPKELYDDLIAKGYDWDILLNTRSWYTTDNDKQPIHYLSTWDLLRMRKGLYHPYWLDSDKRTILPYEVYSKLAKTNGPVEVVSVTDGD